MPFTDIQYLDGKGMRRRMFHQLMKIYREDQLDYVQRVRNAYKGKESSIAWTPETFVAHMTCWENAVKRGAFDTMGQDDFMFKTYVLSEQTVDVVAYRTLDLRKRMC